MEDIGKGDTSSLWCRELHSGHAIEQCGDYFKADDTLWPNNHTDMHTKV